MNYKLTIAMLFVLSLFFSQKVFTQTTVTGHVTDAKTGVPLPGATIRVEGSTVGVSSGIDGKYTLIIPASISVLNAKLVFSFIGYKSQGITINNRSVVDVFLSLEESSLDEVVVIGYGKQSMRYVTGSISKRNMKNTETLPNTSIGQALRGRVAGVQFTETGRSGQSGSILIRGKRSLSASNSPLIVLDGIIFNGSLQDINPNDIESLEVLKDASSAAIYGSRAANGVILISSKIGKTEKPNIRINSFYGFSEYSKKVKLLSPERYLQYIIDYNSEIGNKVDMSNIESYLPTNVAENYKANKITDPWEASSQKASIKSTDLSISGRSERTNYYVSASVVDESGLLYNDQQKRYSFRSNFEGKVTDWMTLGLNFTFAKRDNSGTVPNLDDLVHVIPYGTWYYEDGTVKRYPVDGESVSRNPLYHSLLTKNETIFNNLFTNFNAEIQAPFLKGLSYRINFSPNMRWDHNYNFEINDVHEAGDISYSSKYNQERYDWMLENIVKYKKQINKNHEFDISLLYARNNSYSESTTAKAVRLASEAVGWNDMNLGETQTNTSTGLKTTGVSYMARLNYNYKNKYFFTLTTRKDGSSVFSVNNKYATLPSGAFAWILSDEGFLKNSKVFNLLKLRLSYGAVGNQAIDPYQSLELLGSTRYVFGDGGSSSFGVYPGNMANDKLKWETTFTANAAIDFELLKNRIGGTLEFYNMNTKDLLVTRSIPIMTGFDVVWDNLGATNNKGIELTLNTVNLKSKNFEWRSNFTFSYNKNKIVHLYRSDVDGDGIEDNDLGNNWFIGQPVDVYYDFVFDGIYQVGDDDIRANAKAGYVKLKDINGDKVLDAKDREIIGQGGQPKYRWGIVNDFKYKNFTLSVFINSMQGWISTRNRYISIGRSLNFPDIGWWTPENKSNNLPSITYQNQYGHAYYISRDFVRIQDVSLEYNLPPDVINKAKLSSCKIFVSGKNLYTFTKWEGPDPESGTTSFSNYFPFPRTISLGLNLGF